MASAKDEVESTTNNLEGQDEGEENDDTELGEACGSNIKKRRRRNRHKKGTSIFFDRIYVVKNCLILSIVCLL